VRRKKGKERRVVGRKVRKVEGGRREVRFVGERRDLRAASPKTAPAQLRQPGTITRGPCSLPRLYLKP
jgi:hypothetical protein